MKPIRLSLAQTLCRYLPPILSQRVRSKIYPISVAYSDDYQFSVQSLTGSMFESRTSEYHGYKFAVHGYLYWRAWAIALAICEPGDTIIEIGANIGTETVGFADIVGGEGRVFAFEPFPDNVQSLKHLAELHQY